MFFYDKKLTISILLHVYVYVYTYTYCTVVVVVDKLLFDNRTFISFRK